MKSTARIKYLIDHLMEKLKVTKTRTALGKSELLCCALMWRGDCWSGLDWFWTGSGLDGSRLERRFWTTELL